MSRPLLDRVALISNQLLSRFQIPLGSLVALAQKYEEVAPGQHLFRFYDRPEDWQGLDEISVFAAGQPGIFDIEKVKR